MESQTHSANPHSRARPGVMGDGRVRSLYTQNSKVLSTAEVAIFFHLEVDLCSLTRALVVARCPFRVTNEGSMLKKGMKFQELTVASQMLQLAQKVQLADTARNCCYRSKNKLSTATRRGSTI